MSLTIGVIGLGPMGGHIAGNLIRSGFDVVGYDIRRPCMTALEALGGGRRSRPRKLPNGPMCWRPRCPTPTRCRP